MVPLQKFKFSYGMYSNMTVTVTARDYESAIVKARNTLDRRYERQGKEPPVAWTLTDVAL